MQCILPALTFFTASGDLDIAGNERYAQAAASCRADRYLLFGTTGEGQTLSQDERERLLASWRKCVRADRLVVCGLGRNATEAQRTLDQGMMFMVPPWPTSDIDELARYVHELDSRVMLYSHPARSPLILNAQRLTELRRRDALPAGVKLSKVSVAELEGVHEAVPVGFRVWDGTDRRIEESDRLSAEAVVSQIASTLTVALDCSDLAELQARLDEARASLPIGMPKLQALKLSAGELVGDLSPVTRES